MPRRPLTSQPEMPLSPTYHSFTTIRILTSHQVTRSSQHPMLSHLWLNVTTFAVSEVCPGMHSYACMRHSPVHNPYIQVQNVPYLGTAHARRAEYNRSLPRA